MKRTDIGIDAKFDKYVKTIKKGCESHYIDLRNKTVNDIHYVYPVGFNEYEVIIICPYCGQPHYHGLCDDDHYWGNVMAHCLNGKTYYIKKVRKR